MPSSSSSNVSETDKEAEKGKQCKEADDAALLAWKEKLNDETADEIKDLNKKMNRKLKLKNRSQEAAEE